MIHTLAEAIQVLDERLHGPQEFGKEIAEATAEWLGSITGREATEWEQLEFETTLDDIRRGAQ
jgi:hypothetical protein